MHAPSAAAASLMLTPLPAGTTLGPVSLTVSDLDRALEYYQRRIGLRLHARDGDAARLGVGGPDLLVLTEVPGARHPHRTTGLYHFAILLPARDALARTLQHLVDTRTPLQGLSDHLVSEAIYLADPDGNGIEIYRDRPRSTWTYEDGALRMTTEPLDVDNLMAEVAGRDIPWTGLPAGTTIGHIHLHVADIAQAEHFYRDILGFDITTRYGPSASFVSAGGYHHHVGLNTWAGVGAPPPPPGSVGLRYATIQLPTPESLDRVVERVRAAGVLIEQRDDDVLVRDPSANALLLTAAR
ncbi:MAG TPA: VOC family protein [Gemmatimonadaceae bacterium]|nr:VOC family protein [Gemmatimonadaceae bacterium]